jgi:beta-lactamase class A
MQGAPTHRALPDFQGALDRVRDDLDRIERESGATAVAVSVYDLSSGASLRYRADRWFHAASTIKVAILLGVYAAIQEGRFPAHARLHIRNRFSSAVDGEAFRVSPDRDGNSEVHAAIGKMLRIRELAFHMITTSSNLATNLLLELVGVATVQRALERFGLEGIDLRRCVEDERAFAAGISNRVTADGLVSLLRLIAEERAFAPHVSREMLDILHGQEFKNGIPARLPRSARVAHKTGDISTVAHDAGIVYPAHHPPYVIAVLTEWERSAGPRSQTIADISHGVYVALTGAESAHG